MANVELPLKLYFIPYPEDGHMISLCNIASLFASRGHNVTIITTPSNAQTLNKSIPSLQIHTIPFPSQQAGLPDGIEKISSLHDIASCAKFYKAIALLREPLHTFIHHHPPDCIIADFQFPWVADLAHALRIPRLAFNGFSIFTVCAMESLKAHGFQPESGSGSFVISDFPHHITMRTTPPKGYSRLMESLLAIEAKSNGLIVNSFEELDGEEYLGYYEKITGHKAWHIGPVSLIVRSSEEKAERGEKSVVSVHECLSWLDSKRENSVLYICFGSMCQFQDKQLYEIACAVEAWGDGFIWVVPEKKGKENESEEEKEKWLPKGFEERNENKGMIIRGWAPQVLILGHPAVGSFLTHCGWNSTVEAVSAGVPLITWPVHSEQFYNEKLISEVRGIGVEVGAEEWTYVGFGEREKLVGRDQIERAVRRLMDGGDEAQKIRRRAQEFGNKARLALEEGGSSHNNLTVLIDYLKQLRDCKPLD